MLHNFLRRYRKRSAFSQSEMAFLLGIKCNTKVSKHECFRRVPDLAMVMAYQIIYKLSVGELFPELYTKIATGVVKRAKELSQKLATQSNHPATRIKLEKLETVVSKTNVASPPIYEQKQI